MNTEFSEQKYGESGVKTSFEQMANGEQKYKMIAEDGSYYCRTVASSHGAWQNSHVHINLTEFYVVQTGWIGVCQLWRRSDVFDSSDACRRAHHCPTWNPP